MGKIELCYISGLIGDEKGVIWNLWDRDVCMENLYNYIYIYIYIYIHICMYVYMYIYLCFVRSRGTYPFKYRKMLTEIIFEAYIFKSNCTHNYKRNNCISSIRVFYKFFLNELLCLVLLVTLEKLSMHWFFDLFLFLLIFWALWTDICVQRKLLFWTIGAYMGSAKVTSMDYDTCMSFSILSITNVV